MTKTKTFTTSNPAEVEDFTFKIADGEGGTEEFTCYGDVPAGAIIGIGAASGRPDDEKGAAALVAMESFLAMALHEESLRRFTDRMNTTDRRRRITLDDVSNIVNYLAEVYSSEDGSTPTE